MYDTYTFTEPSYALKSAVILNILMYFKTILLLTCLMNACVTEIIKKITAHLY